MTDPATDATGRVGEDGAALLEGLLHMTDPATDATADAVTDAVVAAAMHVPGDLLEAGTAAIEDTPGWSTQSQSALIGASPAAHYREHAETIARAWSRAPDVAGAVVAAACGRQPPLRKPCEQNTRSAWCGQDHRRTPSACGRHGQCSTHWSSTQRRASCWCRS